VHFQTVGLAGHHPYSCTACDKVSHHSEAAKETMKIIRLSACTLGALFTLASPGGFPIMGSKAKAAESASETRSPTVPRARDPSVAVAEEYEAARRKDTVEAYELFIARHGDDPLAAKARADLRRLSR
jgi:hypothetical protein